MDIIRTNLEFLQEQFNSIAAHVLHCTGQASWVGGSMAWWCAGLQSQHSLLVLPTDSGFGARLLELCNQGLFECLALNLHCLGGQQMELAAVINGRIVSTTPPKSPSLLFPQVVILFGILQFHFSSPNCHALPFDTFQTLVEGFVFESVVCPSASYVSWGEPVLGELADHYDGTEASGSAGAYACGPRCHPQICPQDW